MASEQTEVFEAVKAIRHAVEMNAAPVNIYAAIREVTLDGGCIWIDGDLLIDLFKAYDEASAPTSGDEKND